MRLWHLIIFVVLLAVFAAGLTPVSVLAPSRPGSFSYERAEGSAFDARFAGARLGGLDLGLATWRLDPGALMRGELGGRVNLQGGVAAGAADIALGFNNAARIASDALVFAPLWGAQGEAGIGRADMQGLAVAFAGDACLDARGDATATLSSGPVASMPLIALAGRVACVGNDAQLRMTGERDGTNVEILITAQADGAGAWRITIRAEDPAMQAALAALGLTRGESSWNVSRMGGFRWRP
jgi:hypothetical protein